MSATDEASITIGGKELLSETSAAISGAIDTLIQWIELKDKKKNMPEYYYNLLLAKSMILNSRVINSAPNREVKK